MTISSSHCDANEPYRHPGEVLIFYISRESLFTKLLGDAEIEHGSDNRDMNAAEFKALHNLLAEVNNRCPMSDSDLSTPIEDHKMGEFLNKNDGKGCVLFVFDKRVAGTAAYDVTRGFFSPDQFSAGRKDVVC